MKTDNIILEKILNFSLMSIEYYKKMVSQNEFVLSKQFLKSSTSIGANVNEATAAQTKKDFITKMAKASKEARETKYWITLLEKSQLVLLDWKLLLHEIDEIIKILTSIVKTAQTNEHSTLSIKN
jgi:four helix bundle protein